jgi:cytochrome c oxidase cbb3-type subunit 3
MFARIVLILSLLVLIIGGTVWYRGAREYRPSPVSLAERTDQVTLSRNFPGGSPPVMPSTRTNYDESGYAVSEGSHLYQAFNCNGCHQNGGGGIGPALMDDKWIYGSEPRNIFATIVEGRPNGMPAFRGKIPDAQIWQIVAYVRSMSGLVPAAVRSSREDAMQTHPPTTLQSPETPHPGGNVPPSAERTQ